MIDIKSIAVWQNITAVKSLLELVLDSKLGYTLLILLSRHLGALCDEFTQYQGCNLLPRKTRLERLKR